MDTEIAFKFNDQSVLENHHCLVSFTLLKNDNLNFLENLEKEEFTTFRKLMIKMVLSTDMNVHFANIAKVKSRLANLTEKPLNRDDPADRLLILELILHSADISNVTKPWVVSRPWSERINEEMFNQGDVERKSGFSPEMFTDRTKTTVAQNTHGFIRFVCMKLFQTLPILFPKTKKLIDNINNNLAQWQKIIDKEKEQEKNKQNNK